MNYCKYCWQEDGFKIEQFTKLWIGKKCIKRLDL